MLRANKPLSEAVSDVYHICIIGETHVDTCAQDLANLLCSADGTRLCDKEGKNWFAGIPLEQFGKILFLGHTTQGEKSTELYYNDWTAAKFAALFNKQFEKADKLKIKDVYFIGCQMGLSDQGKNNSLAQQVADELFKKGFIHIRVHAVAYEKKQHDESMRVEVISSEREGIDPDLKPGFIRAYSVDGNTHKKLGVLKKALKNAQAQLDCINEESGVTADYARVGKQKEIAGIERELNGKLTLVRSKRLIGKADHPLAVMALPVNTFEHGETYKEREARINDVRNEILQDAIATVGCLVKKAKAKGTDSPSAEKLKILEDLQKTLTHKQERSDVTESEWRQDCAVAARKYGEKVFVNRLPTVFKSMAGRSTTYEKLCRLGKPPIADKRSAVGLVNPVTDIVPPPAQDKGLISSISSSFLGGDKKEPAPVMEVIIPASIKKTINDQITNWKNEIKELDDKIISTCFSCFFRFEKNTKQAKIEFAEKLSNSSSFEKFQNLANEEKSKTFLSFSWSRVMRNVKTSRMRGLLDEISQAEKGQPQVQPAFKK